jgi:hypothetical protein
MTDLIWYMAGAEWCGTQNGDGLPGYGGNYLGYGFGFNGHSATGALYDYGKLGF